MGTAALIAWLLGTYLTGKEVGNFVTNWRGQNREDKFGDKQLAFLMKKLAAETKGKELEYEHNTADTEKILARLTQEKAGERSERRMERSDILKSQNQQQQLALIMSLMQSIGNMGQQNINTRQQLKEPPPISITGLLRGGY